MIQFSIIIATHNRSDSLPSTLDSLLAQNLNDEFDYELIVIDNNSSDSTQAKVRSYENKFAGKLRYLQELKQGKAFAMNKGIIGSKGKILIFTDDDVVLDENWLINIWKCYQYYQCDGVGGRVLPLYPQNTPQWVKDNHSFISGPLVMYDQGKETKLYTKEMIEFLGANYSFKRQVFEGCGFFRTDIGPGIAYVGEDTEFVKRALSAGKKLYYCGQACVWHPTDIKRMNLRYFAKWYSGLGKSRFLVDEKETVDKNLTKYFGVPRYLIREILQSGLSLIVKIFNKREFLKTWKALFINVGRATAMRRAHLCSK